MGILKRSLLVVGILLCLYPALRQQVARQEEVIESDAIGVLGIPDIHVLLPIYHGTSEEVLQKGIGHLEWSSPLGGGKSTHCLLAGHRGLPQAKLLARLGEIEKGDCFYIEAEHSRITYQVCDIRVVRPEDTEGLGVWEDKDLVSLITCTPYGINTHRLIVTGERMEGKE